MKPTLVILAAGIGSRYGGAKQTEGFGPDGSAILEYAVFDALRAGFGKLVVVIRPDMQASFRETIGRRIEPRIDTRYALQTLEALPSGFVAPAGRSKPWGTGHAVLVAAPLIAEPFVVINADDYYGPSAYRTLAQFFAQSGGAAGEDAGAAGGRATGLSPGGRAQVSTHALVGYVLRDTLAEAGTVSRGVCRVSADGWLESITEMTRLERAGDDARQIEPDGSARIVSGQSPVSMNFWGFAPDALDAFARQFEDFLRREAGSHSAEFYIPTVVQELIRSGAARFRVERSRDPWVGITHREDRPRVQAFLRRQVEQGVYPAELWR